MISCLASVSLLVPWIRSAARTAPMAFLQSKRTPPPPRTIPPLSTCCTKLQEHNAKLKAQIAQLDAELRTRRRVTGIGCDHPAIAALCSARESAARHSEGVRELYGKELRETVKKNASGDYDAATLALAPPDGTS